MRCLFADLTQSCWNFLRTTVLLYISSESGRNPDAAEETILFLRNDVVRRIFSLFGIPILLKSQTLTSKRQCPSINLYNRCSIRSRALVEKHWDGMAN